MMGTRKLPPTSRRTAAARRPLIRAEDLQALTRDFGSRIDSALKGATDKLCSAASATATAAAKVESQARRPYEIHSLDELHPHPLEPIFKDAVDQARKGKGNARHGLGRDFMSQTWLETANAHGPAFLTGQAEKKLRESGALPYAQRRTERLGALVYLAMSIIKDDLDNQT